MGPSNYKLSRSLLMLSALHRNFESKLCFRVMLWEPQKVLLGQRRVEKKHNHKRRRVLVDDSFDRTARKILLYYDDVNLCNPLSNKMHKIALFYCQLANLQVEYRSEMNSIHLLAVCKTMSRCTGSTASLKCL